MPHRRDAGTGSERLRNRRPRHPRRVPPRGFGAGDVRDATPPPEDVEAALVAARSDASKGDERDARRVPARVRRTRTGAGGRRRTRSARGGSSPETPEDAAARLDEVVSRERRRRRWRERGARARARATSGRGVCPDRDERGGPRARGGHGVVARTVCALGRRDGSYAPRRGDAGTVCVCEHVARTRRGA